MQLALHDEISFVPMEAVGEYGGLKLEAARPAADLTSTYTYFRDGDVVVAKITPCFENGKGALAQGLRNGVAVGTTELHVLRALADVLDSRYLFYLTISGAFRSLGEASMYGAGGQKRVPDTFIRDFRIGLPPLSEQGAIANFLDRETARIDALVEAKRRLITLLHEKRAALIARVVTRGLDAHVPTKDSGMPWLGRVPAHWRVVPLKRMVQAQGGLTPDKGRAEYWDGDVPWITPKDMKKLRLSDSEDHTTALALEETSLLWIEPPAALIVVRGMILAHTFPVAEIGAPVTINQDMKALTANAELSTSYLCWLMRGASSFVLSCAEESAHGTKVLRTEVLFNAGFPLPPLKEQCDIAAHIEAESAKLAQAKTAVEEAVARLTEYRSTLITAAITGRIDVRSAA